VRAVALLACLTAVCLPRRAAAQSADWLRLESASDCSISADALAQRVDQALVGTRDPELAVSVTIVQRSEGYEVTLQTTSATKVVSAPDCEEAIETAVVVLALALGAPEAATESAAAVQTEPEPADPAPPAALQWSASADEPALDSALPRPSPGALRLALSTGVDSGTLPTSTAYVAAGLRHALGAFELRGVLRYGLPYVEELETDVASQRTELDFATFELGACYGFGQTLRASGCAGGELGVLRRASNETDETSSRFSGVLSTVLAYRGGLIEPELELSALAPTFAVRAGVGAALRF